MLCENIMFRGMFSEVSNKISQRNHPENEVIKFHNVWS